VRETANDFTDRIDLLRKKDDSSVMFAICQPSFVNRSEIRNVVTDQHVSTLSTTPELLIVVHPDKAFSFVVVTSIPCCRNAADRAADWQSSSR